MIDGAKLAAFFGDLGVNVSGPGPLALAWQYKCSSFATVERSEFNAYYSARGIDSLAAMKSDAKRVTDLLSDKVQFKVFYRWLFEFVKEEEERKTIDNSMAFSLWSCVLPVHWSLTNEWVAFCRGNKSLKMVSQDLWGQLWEFVKDCKADLSNYDDDGNVPLQHCAREMIAPLSECAACACMGQYDSPFSLSVLCCVSLSRRFVACADRRIRGAPAKSQEVKRFGFTPLAARPHHSSRLLQRF